MEKTIGVRLTEAEAKALEAYAKRCGTSKNQAIKRLLLGADFFDYIVNYFELAHLEELTQAVKPLLLQELCKQNRSRCERERRELELKQSEPAEP